jgi:hypothetical protein
MAPGNAHSSVLAQAAAGTRSRSTSCRTWRRLSWRAQVADSDGLVRMHSLAGDTRERVRDVLEPLQQLPRLGSRTRRTREGFRFILGPWRWMLRVYVFDETVTGASTSRFRTRERRPPARVSVYGCSCYPPTPGAAATPTASWSRSPPRTRHRDADDRNVRPRPSRVVGGRRDPGRSRSRAGDPRGHAGLPAAPTPARSACVSAIEAAQEITKRRAVRRSPQDRHDRAVRRGHPTHRLGSIVVAREGPEPALAADQLCADRHSRPPAHRHGLRAMAGRTIFPVGCASAEPARFAEPRISLGSRRRQPALPPTAR